MFRKLIATVASKTKITFAILCCLSAFLNAQNLSNPFKSLKEKKEFIYGLDNRRTHINQQGTAIYGLYTGIGFGGKFRLKMGVSGMLFERGELVDEHYLIKKNKMYFLTLGEEFDFFIKSKLRLTTYIQAGIGYNYFRKLNQLQMEIISGKSLILPIEIGVQSSYDVFTWLSLKVGVGWRFVKPIYSSDLSGYYFKLGTNINSKILIDKYRKNKSPNH